MNKKMGLVWTVATLLAAGSPDAGSDFGVSNRFALGDTDPVVRPAASGFDPGTFHVTVRQEHRRFVFSAGRPGSGVTAGIYSIKGQKVSTPVPVLQGMWCWTPDEQIGTRCGAGLYLAIFTCGKARSTVPLIVEP